MGLFDEIGTLFGGGPNNAEFTAASAPIQMPTTVGQATDAYGNAQGGLNQQQLLINALNGQNGIGNQNSVFGQLQGVANGTGPNPAQAMLNQATGQNIASQAALMAGQRGASANPGLIARQAALQGGALQQNAVGQGAALQANQSLGALGQLGGLASNQAANQIGAVGNYNQFAQGEQNGLLNSINAQNNANVSNTANMNNANAGLATTNANNSAKAIGGLVNGISGAFGLNNGGAASLLGGGGSGGAASGVGGGAAAPFGAADYGSSGLSTSGLFAPAAAALYSGGMVPAHFKDLHSLYHGKELKMKSGGVIPGKASVKGDSPKNDTVPVMASPGEVMLPRSVMQADDPAKAASKFVSELLKKHAGSPEGEFREALNRSIQGRKKK